ncbi:ABC transporter ATP-binding protein [Psychromonas aquimarina]|uniref:ABC transporter ATP-binding protein n=1 Tax=Psychromonas aquimarina TaxID=444919 RepID=UPI0003F74CD2|nr:ABC transporter ATP-binding protein [Psychromonas aquimarina]
MCALLVKQLSCFYQHNQVLNLLDLKLEKNEIVCLLGESGCGKTTLLRAVAGLQKRLSGSIEINGKTVNDSGINITPEKRKVGLIFQDYALFPHLNVFDNVAFSLNKLTALEKKERVNDVLSLVQLSDYAERFPHQLSGGQQQRIAIARALAYQPDLMLLDEPFSNLDHHVRFQLIREIRSLLKARSMSALFVTHSKEEGFAFADKIALMQAGKIVQIDSAQVLYQRPKSMYVADFMGQSNYLNVSVNDDYSYQSDLGLLTSNTLIRHKKDQELSLLLRPEQIVIELDQQSSAEVLEVEFLGAYQQITVSYLNKIYIVKHSNHLHNSMQFNIGDRVSLKVLSHDFVVFES